MLAGQKNPSKQSEDKIMKAIEDRIITNVRNLFEQEEEIYYEPVKVSNFYNSKYVEYGLNGGRNKALSIRKYFDEIEPYLKDMNCLKKCDTILLKTTKIINNLQNLLQTNCKDKYLELHLRFFENSS